MNDSLKDRQLETSRCTVCRPVGRHSSKYPRRNTGCATVMLMLSRPGSVFSFDQLCLFSETMFYFGLCLMFQVNMCISSDNTSLTELQKHSCQNKGGKCCKFSEQT